MAKIRATKLPASRDYILKPNRVRMFLVYIIVFSLAIILGSGIRWLFYRDTFTSSWVESQGFATALVILVGSLLMVFTEYSRWTLRLIGGNILEGPTGIFGDRETISIDSIDWKRTARSLNSWLKIGNAIYAQSSQRILISPWFFTPSELRDMLDRMGYH